MKKLRKWLCYLGFHTWRSIGFEKARIGGPYAWLVWYSDDHICRHCNRLKH